MEFHEAQEIVRKMSDALKVIKESADVSEQRKEKLVTMKNKHDEDLKKLKQELAERKLTTKLWNTVSFELGLQICIYCNGVGEDSQVYADDYGNGGVDYFFCDKCNGKGYITKQ